MTAPAIHARTPTKLGVASFRDMSGDDAEWMTDYFMRPDAHLDTLIDRSRKGPRQVLVDRFRALERTGDPAQQRSSFVIDLDGRRVGFTSLYRQTPEVNYSHWHIVDDSVRA